MLFDDQLLMLRLQSEPEFVCRLAEFLLLRRLSGHPVLVLQARPSEATLLDLESGPLRTALREGCEDITTPWEGFFSRSRQPQPAFHGLSFGGTKWALEAHRDAHFVAAIWNFPNVPEGRSGPGVSVPANFWHAFVDFFQIVASAAEAAALNSPFRATATLVCSDALSFSSGTGPQASVASEALGLGNLQWPIGNARPGSMGWIALGMTMGKALCSAYGREAPRSRQ